MTTSISAQADAIIGDIEQFLMDLIHHMAPDRSAVSRAGPGRPRILPELCLWGALLVCVLKGDVHQLAIWRLLTVTGLWFYPRFPLTDQAVYKRLATGGTAALETLFEHVTALLRDRLAPFVRTTLAAFATEVYALDETTLDKVARLLPSLRAVPPGDDRLLPGKLAGLFDIRRQQWVKVQAIADPHQNEKVAARSMIAHLPRGCLVLVDLYSFQSGIYMFSLAKHVGFTLESV